MSYLTPHSSGVQVLAAPTHPDADFRVSVDQLERALAILRPRFDEVIVDCGSRLDPRIAVDARAGVDPRVRHLPGDRRAAGHQRPARLPGGDGHACAPRRTSW